MAYDGIVISSIISEIRKNCLGGRVVKVQQPSADIITLTMKGFSGQVKLYISANASLPIVYIADTLPQAPMQAPAFCMLLRKHLGNGRLTDIRQPGFDRIYDFVFEHFEKFCGSAHQVLFWRLYTLLQKSFFLFNPPHELIVVFTNTFMAGQYSRIYTWDAAAQQATDYVFMVGAYCSFYHGEIVQEFASHNQGPSSLWPYAVFWYDAEVQAYQHAFSASSVDESLDPNHNEYKPENDVDGDGVIYYIYKPNHDYSKDPEPLTYDAFQHYVDAYIPEQNRIEMTYVTMTMENINALR